MVPAVFQKLTFRHFHFVIPDLVPVRLALLVGGFGLFFGFIGA